MFKLPYNLQSSSHRTIISNNRFCRLVQTCRADWLRVSHAKELLNWTCHHHLAFQTWWFPARDYFLRKPTEYWQGRETTPSTKCAWNSITFLLRRQVSNSYQQETLVTCFKIFFYPWKKNDPVLEVIEVWGWQERVGDGWIQWGQLTMRKFTSAQIFPLLES